MSKLNEMAQARGYFEGLEGKERYPRAFHPNQYGAYNLGHKHGTFIRESGQ